MDRRFITCRELIDTLSDYVEGQIGADARNEIDRHLAVCPPCQRFLESFRQTIQAGHTLRDTPCDDIPEELVRAILDTKSKAAAPGPDASGPSDR